MLLIATSGLLYVVYEPFREAVRPIHNCLLHELTGFLCPACGGTRAMMHLLRGELVTALRYNSLIVVLLPIFSYTLVGLIRIVSDRNRSLADIQFHPFWAWGLLAAVIIFFIARNLPYLNYLGYPW